MNNSYPTSCTISKTLVKLDIFEPRKLYFLDKLSTNVNNDTIYICGYRETALLLFYFYVINSFYAKIYFLETIKCLFDVLLYISNINKTWWHKMNRTYSVESRIKIIPLFIIFIYVQILNTHSIDAHIMVSTFKF